MHFGREELVRRVFAMGLNLNAQLIECYIIVNKSKVTRRASRLRAGVRAQGCPAAVHDAAGDNLPLQSSRGARQPLTCC